MEGWLDRLDATGRWALIKLVTGGLRIGVSARLAKQAVADLGGRPVNEIEEVWHGLAPPYTRSVRLAGRARAERRNPTVTAPFRPVMLSHAIADDELTLITPEAYAAEWKWDGIRVQAVREAGVVRLYTRTGDDISVHLSRPRRRARRGGALDGELLVGAPGRNRLRRAHLLRPAAAAEPQDGDGQAACQPPGVSARLRCLVDGGEDIRALPFRERRQRLEALVARSLSGRMDLSPLLAFANGDELAALRAAPPEAVIEGVMLKRWDSVYEPGRPKGPWFKWKRDPHTVDAVLMYAQRGHGKRSSYYSDYTFGVWRAGEAGEELVPVGKAYFGFTDEELAEIDRFVRNNTVARFGPVREVVHEADEGAGARGRLRGAAALDPPPLRARHALSAHIATADGTSRRARPTGWRRWRRCCGTRGCRDGAYVARAMVKAIGLITVASRPTTPMSRVCGGYQDASDMAANTQPTSKLTCSTVMIAGLCSRQRRITIRI